MRGVAFLGLLFGAGCEFSRGPITLASDDPVVQIPAMKQAVKLRRTEDMPSLVQLLDDSDPAVRMFAIGSLVKMTGMDLGYHYYDGELQRAKAISAWRVLAGLSPTTIPSSWLPETRPATTETTTPPSATQPSTRKGET